MEESLDLQSEICRSDAASDTSQRIGYFISDAGTPGGFEKYPHIVPEKNPDGGGNKAGITGYFCG